MQGQYEDQETGLYYNRYRYFDPSISAYISQDPIRLNAGTNLYCYCLNGIMWVDPLGLCENSVGGNVKTDFYVRPNGDVIPSTGYRYMDSKYAEQTFKTNSAPGSYFGFEKFNSAKDAQNAFQIAPEWSDCRMRGEFDTIQVIDDIYIPTTYGNTTNILEPLTVSYPEYGTGGIYQMKVDEVLNFKNLEIIEK